MPLMALGACAAAAFAISACGQKGPLKPAGSEAAGRPGARASSPAAVAPAPAAPSSAPGPGR